MSPRSLAVAALALVACSRTPDRTRATDASPTPPPSEGPSWQEYGVHVDRGIPTRMRDGTVLVSDVYRPNAPGPFPVLLERTPYDRGRALDAARGASHGYIVIVQDVRGRFESEGEWYPFRHETEDGYDTVEWAARIGGATGQVGMFGASYVGATQLLAAITRPPHLAGIFPQDTASDYHDGWIYRGGALEQHFVEKWADALAVDTLRRRASAAIGAGVGLGLPLPKAVTIDAGAATLAPYYQDWLAHPADDDYWKVLCLECQHGKIGVPAFHVSGWYDLFLRGTLRNFAGIAARGASDAARRGQRLLIGPWIHDDYSRRAGEYDFGPEVCGDAGQLDLFGRTLLYYDWLLKGAPNGEDREKPVRLFVMGKNVWRDEEAWPLARARPTRYLLHSRGHANGSGGDGALAPAAQGAEAQDVFTYDPANPVPTRGGPCCGSQSIPGVVDQRGVEARGDVLVYSTAPMTSDLEVTGPVTVDLFASTSAVDADFTAKLVDVAPDGSARNLTDGIVRARYRTSQERAQLAIPGQVMEMSIDLAGTSNVFLAGHRVRLEISSSNFPRFDRNLGTEESPERGARFVKATQTVFHDAAHPSAVILPVVPPEPPGRDR